MPTVLVVEDERDIRELLRRYLERADYAVLSSGTGADALRHIDEGGVASGDRRACGIVGGGGTFQIASWTSSNAVAKRITGATSTPSS